MRRFSVACALSLAIIMVAATTVAGPEKMKFPAGYKKNHVLYTTVDRPDNKTVRDLYANSQAAAAARESRPLPSGSVLTMEVYKAKLDGNGDPAKDASGRFIKDKFAAIVVMEKRSGWGAEYPEEVRNGEWEYAKFTPSGARPESSDMSKCFACHKSQSDKDFVFSLDTLAAGDK